MHPNHPAGECEPCDRRRANQRAAMAAKRARQAAENAPRFYPRIELPSLPLDRPEDWTHDALCAQVAGDVFFPEKGESTAPAKAICRKCNVTTECLEYALARNERFGVYGGYSERERRRLARGDAA